MTSEAASDHDPAEPHGPSQDAPAGRGRTERARQAISARAHDRQVAAAIKGLDRRERALGLVAAGMVAALWLLLTVPTLLNPPKHLKKGQLDATQIGIYLLVGLALAALVAVATLLRRRALLGFAVLFAGASFGGLFLLALPFWAFGAWLLWRAFITQRAAGAPAHAGGAPGGIQRSPGRGGLLGGMFSRRRNPDDTAYPHSASPTRVGAKSASRRERSTATSDRQPPTPSKRYTPPKPPARATPKPTPRRSRMGKAGQPDS